MYMSVTDTKIDINSTSLSNIPTDLGKENRWIEYLPLADRVAAYAVFSYTQS